MPLPDADLAAFIREKNAQVRALTTGLGAVLGMLQAANVLDEASIDNLIQFAIDRQPAEDAGGGVQVLQVARNVARVVAGAAVPG